MQKNVNDQILHGLYYSFFYPEEFFWETPQAPPAHHQVIRQVEINVWFSVGDQFSDQFSDQVWGQINAE